MRGHVGQSSGVARSVTLCQTCKDRGYTCMWTVTDVVTGEADPGAYVWCKAWVVKYSIVIHGLARRG